MKKTIILSIILSILIFSLFYYSNETFLITKDNIDIFINVLVPNLFPYLMLVLLFVNFDCHLLFAYFLQYISIPLFNISGKTMSIILIGILGGYPLLAILSKEIIDKDNEKEINKIIPLFSYPSFAFLHNIILKNTNFNYFIYFLIASLIILFISKDNQKQNYLTFYDIKELLINNKNIINKFSNSLNKSLNSLCLIFSNLMFFSLFKVLFKFNNDKINYLFLSIFEFTKSSIYFSMNIHNINDLLIIGIILLFGGFSINMQILSIYSDSLLNIKKYYKYRLLLIIFVIFLIYIN